MDLGVVLDLFARGGVTKEGRRIWNERDPLGDKISKGFKYATYELSPFSAAQVYRLYKATLGETVKGTQYKIPDELMGLCWF